MAVYERNGIWYIDYYYEGKRIRECIGSSKVLAKKALAVRKGDIIQKRFKMPTTQTGVKFEEFLEDYLAYTKSYKRSFIRDVYSAKNLLPHFKGQELNNITPLFIEKYKQQRNEKVKPATINRELSALRHMFNTAIRWGKMDKNPMSQVNFYKEENLPLRFLSETEMGLLIKECSIWLKPIVITALNTGMRKQEILDLEWRNVDIDFQAITVERSKSKEFRLIPMNETLSDLFGHLPRRSQFVFPNDEGIRFVTIKTGFNAAVRRAGIRHTRFHDLRHTFASQLIMNGVDLVTIKELLGHKDVSMTMRYAHLSAEHKRQAVEKFPKVTEKYSHNMVTQLKIVRGK